MMRRRAFIALLGGAAAAWPLAARALQPDLIVTQNTPGTAAMLQQTRAIPIIFVNVVDPVGSGFVANFPRPGGNVTGFISLEPTIAGKWLELLKEIEPHIAKVAFLF